MRMPTVFGFLVILLLALGANVTARAQAFEGQIPDSTELRVLRQFYYATNGPDWSRNDHWLEGSTVASAATWYGVQVTGGDVTSLSLPANNLSGQLPSSLGQLSKLLSLLLSGNNLNGPIPLSLGQTDLSNLDLSNCQLTGSIPAELGRCSNMSFLNLGSNQLIGIIPTSLGRLRLYQLILSNNKLTGIIPNALGRITTLSTLQLSHNNLKGALPDSLQFLTNLTYCFLDHNALTGDIPATLTRCYNLSQLDLSYNNLTGALPHTFTTLPRLHALVLTHNNLTAIPSWAGAGNIPGFVLAQENYLDFGSIEPNFIRSGQSWPSQFDYSAQRTGLPDTVRGVAGAAKTLHRGMKGTLNHYQWERHIGNSWVDVPGATDSTLTISHLTSADGGLYRVRVWNDMATSWGHYTYLYTRPQYVLIVPYQPLAENLPVDNETGYAVTDLLAPHAFTGSTDSLTVNYVRTFSARAAIPQANSLRKAAVDSAQVKTEYIDGLGRLMQTVLRQESPLRRDIVQPVAYDDLGRQGKSYLPYTAATTSNGTYRANAIREQYEFYHDSPPGPGSPTDGIARTGVPYSESAFDASPLNRVVAQAAPGEAWQLSTDHVVTLQERPNTTADAVQRYTVGYTTQAAALTPQGGYAAGQLWVKETRDEQRVRTLEFQDKQGQIVLKRVETGTPQQQSPQWLDTYYVFDDLNRLRAVLPPKAVALLRTQQWQVTPAVENLLFRYRYDDRGRLAARQVPGTQGETQLIYDQLDRVILSQDAAQRQRHQWLFTKYDALNRPVLTGLCVRNASQDSLQAEAGRTMAQFEHRTSNSPYSYTLTQAYPQLTPQARFTGAQVLTITHYDDYNFDNDAAGQPDAAYDAQYDSQFATGRAPQPDTRVTGQVTRTRTRVLGVPESAPGAWLTTTTFYDDQSRPIQVRMTNARGGEDISTTQLDFAGKVLKSYTVHSDPHTLPVPVAVAETFTYDHTGRLLTNAQQITGETTPTILARLHYNELGQLQQKQLGLGQQSLDYQYNIRGWLTHLNDAAQRDPNDLWGMELYYDHGFTRNYHQYNGNITGQKWRSKADTITRAYGYIYDKSNRLLQGDFVARAVNGTWTAEKQNYGLHYMSYDENGNILTMQRRGLVANASTTASKQYGFIDKLTYAYQGNQLTSVQDAIPATAPVGSSSLAGDFQDNRATALSPGPEYTYDLNGNLTADYNKGITSIAYNHLNLPRRITLGSDSIVFRYTATGQKVTKLVYQGQKPVQQTDYAGSFQYEQDSLRFFPHAEGRVLRFATRDDANQLQVRYTREYSLKDHLGNLRLAYRTGDSARYVATMEAEPTSVARREEQQFDSASVVRSRFNAGVDARTGTYVARLNAALGQPLGPIKILRVQKGDTIRVTAAGMYHQEVRSTNFTFSLLSFVANLLQQQPKVSSGAETAPKLRPLPFLGLSLSLLPALQQHARVPKGYVRLLAFNKDSVLVHNQTQQLTSAAHGHYETLHTKFVAPADGYVQAYVGNESDTDVFFDDIEVRYNPTLLVQENHYDPWGLNLAGIERVGGVLENKFQYNGKEKQLDLGLNWQDYGARMYDAQLGRWHAVDPLAESYISWSTYNYVRDNPVLRLDINGKWDITVHSYSNRSKYGYGIAVVTDNSGKEVYSFKVRLEGDGGRDRKKKYADTPIGTYDIPDKDMWKNGGSRDAYGPNDRLILTPESGEIVETGRDDIRIHGGRQEKYDPKLKKWIPIGKPKLGVTNGCLRAFDEDMKELKMITTWLEQSDEEEKGGKLVIVEDLQETNNLLPLGKTYNMRTTKEQDAQNKKQKAQQDFINLLKCFSITQ
ncbi:DUF6443 domain-containing protein [Hymenobacter metallicola]|nr:DUF6443 domain-containing protein [Hymenobacter metallicola]